jgi:alkaline phosphatase D
MARRRFAGFGGDDFGNAFAERGEICDFIEQHGITGFTVVSGDRHSFWAGLAAKALPPKEFKPVGLAFVTGSLSAPGMVEAYEHRFPKDHPLSALYGPGINMLLKHGVRSCLEYARSGDAAKARELSNPDLAPHVSFVDMGGHGYAVVRAAADSLETEFVGIPRPLERSERANGGPLNYLVRSSAKVVGERGESQTHSTFSKVIETVDLVSTVSRDSAGAVVPPPCGRPRGGEQGRDNDRAILIIC